MTVRLCNRDNCGIVFYQNSAGHHDPEFDCAFLPPVSVLEAGGGAAGSDLASLFIGRLRAPGPFPEKDVPATKQFHSTVSVPK